MFRYSNQFTPPTVLNDSEKRVRYYRSVIDPIIPRADDDIYVMTTEGDRLDSLAFQYYKDSSYWWIISTANPSLRKDSIVLESGIQLRIPRDPRRVISLVEEVNQSR